MKIIMIDSFKPEYLEYAPYLSHLTKKFQWGELEMPLGFEGGMKTFFYGGNDMLAFFHKKENSRLKWTKKVQWMGRLPVEILINLQRLLSRKRLFRTGNIPLKKLYKFDTEIGKPFEKIRGVEYLYIGEIDKIAHKYGTKSEETKKIIREIDRRVSKLKFDIILSDHGMIDIKKIISVPETKDCMIDSTFARYWGEKPNFNSKDGEWIDWKDKRYGDYIFLANPSVLILPNYWQGRIPVKAMHGYNPKCREMNGIYILNEEGKKKNLKVIELNKIFREKLKNDRTEVQHK
ncbi:Type I phosphodiesterase / nucleotide pyrophosphatase [uncultured archaeon]|nr:Type I phosphodiesterase / nucleotide pyrophosphatase [uncultured archaeon]